MHRWDVTPKEAVKIQRRLIQKVYTEGEIQNPGLVAGADIALDKERGLGFAAIHVFDFPALTVLETRTARGPLRFPYVPGLLTFREGPLLLKLAENLELQADVFFFDGHGTAHPRRMGIATHLGLWLGCPTVGLAKSRLCGTYSDPGQQRGCRSALRHNGETVGTVLRTRDNVRPIFVSPGHKISLDEAVRLTLCVSDGFRIPRPTRLADQTVGRLKRGEMEPDFHFEQEIDP